MTIELQRSRPQIGLVTRARRAPGNGAGEPRRWRDRHPEWPIVALLAGYPIWWALGVADFSFIIFAFPMANRLFAWRAGGRPVRVPPGFGLWMLFLIATVASGFALTLTAPDAIPGVLSHRLISFTERTMAYTALTVVLLYAGNLTESELARRRLAWLLGLVAIYATVGGLAGMIMPTFQFSSPTLALIPGSLHSNPLIQASMHPSLAQVENILGFPLGRPKAPFDYTNTWGNCLTLLLPWLLVAWWALGTRRQRLIAGSILALSMVPIVYSLNRGVWIGIGFAASYLAVRLALRGRLAMIGVIAAAIALIGLALIATPLQNIVATRLTHGQSDQARSSLSGLAFRAAVSSPVLGYGDTRQQRGSAQSIAVGPSATCPGCGSAVIGSNGQLWLILVSEGFTGALFYVAFFCYGIWRYRRDGTPYGLAGVLVLLLTLLYMFTYVAVPVPLGFSVLAYALLWRNDRELSRQRAQAALSERATGQPAAQHALSRGQ